MVAKGNTSKTVDFLGLPREIRDIIYTEVILWEKPTPTLGGAQWLFRFRRVSEPQSSIRGEYGCAYSLDKTPTTCANFLACNRQIYHEMMDAIRRARRRDLMKVKLDCIAEDESFHYFTWRAVPLVKTGMVVQEMKSRMMPSWADKLLERFFGYPHRMVPTTHIQQLWVDIRLAGDRSAKWLRNSSPPDRTSWALCAALRRFLESGPNFRSTKAGRTAGAIVDELVLNVVTPPNYPKERYLDEDFAADGMQEGLVHPHTVARELVDVWNRIWAGEEYKGGFYQTLLERIKTVRVCINEKTWRVRTLKLELEKGQAEQLRIAARTGWL